MNNSLGKEATMKKLEKEMSFLEWNLDLRPTRLGC